MEITATGSTGNLQTHHYQQKSQQVQAQQAATPSTEEATQQNLNINTTAGVSGTQGNDQVKLSSAVTVKNLDTVKAIEQMHARMNQLVKGVREANEEINKVVEQVNVMQSSLTAIMKNFPPFPLDSKERQELLMSYTSIRQEMMRMTVPQPPPPIYEQVKHQWDTTVGQNGQMLASAVPALDSSSSDAQVKSASAQLEASGRGLADLSSAITQALIGG